MVMLGLPPKTDFRDKYRQAAPVHILEIIGDMGHIGQRPMPAQRQQGKNMARDDTRDNMVQSRRKRKRKGNVPRIQCKGHARGQGRIHVDSN